MKSKWKIKLEKETETIGSRIYKVVVFDAGKEYIFRTEVDKNYSNELFGIEVSNLLLVQQSFMFLLKNEPVTSILRDFNLREIQKYFGDYEDALREIFLS